MNPFTQMATTLIATPAPAWLASDTAEITGSNRTEHIRHLLRSARRPVSAAEIAFDMEEHFQDFGPSRVWLLLKYDMQKGRVILEDGKYRWNHEYDTAEAAAIRDAVKLLKHHGYKVKGPAA